MQEKELRLDMLQFLDDLESAITMRADKVALEDIKEYRQYLQETTIIKKLEVNNDQVATSNI